MSVTQPLRDEHAELVPHIDALASAGDAVGRVGTAELLPMVDASLDFLANHLLPHAEAEERELYPAVQRAMGAPEATATMSRDHEEVHALTDELGVLRQRVVATNDVGEDVAAALRRVLYGLHHVVKLHFAKEEEIYLPILDAHLSDEDAEALFAAMQHGGGHRSHAHG